jgi:hypothetical protein
MEHTRTTREPKQAIPTFAETIELLMREENRHVKFNVGHMFQLFCLRWLRFLSVSVGANLLMRLARY